MWATGKMVGETAARLTAASGARDAKTTLIWFLLLKGLGVTSSGPTIIHTDAMAQMANDLFAIPGDDKYKWFDPFGFHWQSWQPNGGWPIGSLWTRLRQLTPALSEFIQVDQIAPGELSVSFRPGYESIISARLPAEPPALADVGSWLMRTSPMVDAAFESDPNGYLRQVATEVLHLSQTEVTLFANNDVPVDTQGQEADPEAIRSALPPPPSTAVDEASRRGVKLPPHPEETPLIALEAYRLLADYKNVILHGAPGTGKTHAALAVQDIWKSEHGDDSVSVTTFHPSYSYEDFMEGYRPSEVDPSKFVLTPGLLMSACENCTKVPTLLVIDEINRADVARVFGEAITFIEADKRDVLFTTSQRPGVQRSIPQNLFILGTMNTADKSISLMDIAFRRRFKFVESPPNPSAYEDVPGWRSEVLGVSLSDLLVAINSRLANLGVGQDRLLGHAMLAVGVYEAEDVLFDRLRYDVLPLIQEYLYGDLTRVRRVLPGLLGPDDRPITDQMTSALLLGLVDQGDPNDQAAGGEAEGSNEELT